MKKITYLVVNILLIFSFSFSQTAYDKCVEECIKAGGDRATCSNEMCDKSDTIPVVTVGQGNPLYLFSYELKGPAPVIDGSLMSRDGDPSTSEAMDEWKEAYSRTIVLNDSGIVQLFLCNTKDTLYVGITYEHNNNGDGCGVRLLFDEGSNILPSQYDGSTDMKLTAYNKICNEQGCAVYKYGGGVLVEDLCWNGTSWIKDGDGKTDLRAAKYYFNSDLKVHHNEFAIPLNNGKSDDSANSDLNVNYNDVLGFYIEVIKMGSGAGTWHWAETNGNPAKPDSFPFWAKIQLSVKRDFFTFYPGRALHNPPVIDGIISQTEWQGAYKRELILSNFHYGIYRAIIWCLEDSAQKDIYVGLRVFDSHHNPQDYCQIYFEEVGEDTSSKYRDFDLDNNAENSLRITNANEFTDMYWNMNNGAWQADPEPQDSQLAKAGETQEYTDYEFKILRKAGLYDIDIPKSSFLGFNIKYYDADKTLKDFAYFFWEYTTNNDAQLLDQQGHPWVYIATGWTNMQLGGPYINVISPTEVDTFKGIMPVKISTGSDSISSAVCFLSSDTLNKIPLVYMGNGNWEANINLGNTAIPNGSLLVIRIVSIDNIEYERVVNIPDKMAARPIFFIKKSDNLNVFIKKLDKLQHIFITQNIPMPVEISLYKLNGKMLLKRDINTKEKIYKVDISFIKSGIYLLKVNSGKEKIMQKIIIK